MTPLGPAWVRVSFAADCQFTMRIQRLYARIRESGHYGVKDGVVIFERRSGTTRWPYRVDGVRLELQEAADERYVYERGGLVHYRGARPSAPPKVLPMSPE